MTSWPPRTEMQSTTTQRATLILRRLGFTPLILIFMEMIIAGGDFTQSWHTVDMEKSESTSIHLPWSDTFPQGYNYPMIFAVSCHQTQSSRRIGTSLNDNARHLREVRFAAEAVGDESISCPVGPASSSPAGSLAELYESGRLDVRTMARISITVYYTPEFRCEIA